MWLSDRTFVWCVFLLFLTPQKQKGRGLKGKDEREGKERGRSERGGKGREWKGTGKTFKRISSALERTEAQVQGKTGCDPWFFHLCFKIRTGLCIPDHGGL